MDEVEFAKFPDEFDVTQHLELCHRPLLLLLRGEGVVMFVKDYKEINKKFKHLMQYSDRLNGKTISLTVNILGTVLKLILKF